MDYLLFLADFVGLVAGGDRLVANALRLAHRAGLSVLVADVVIVEFGTTLPELVTSVDANLQGYQGAAIGNILGSNIANLLLVLGVSTLWLPAAVDPVSAKRDGA